MNRADAPRLAHEIDALADAARYLLRQREAQYPRLIEAGKLKQADAVEKLERARALVAQWNWAADRTAGPIDWEAHDPNRGAFGPWNYELLDEITTAAARQRIAADRVPNDAGAARLADLYAALAWWQAECAGVARIVMETDVRRRGALRQPDRLREAA
ncbi:hypothetical protein DFR49_3393 [Hephaestia caeni]|uniref:Uncharacterized protein n=1 Tax=Hephaestia caeni TaxID=645617 RepID=A0A397NMB2_9SPHN|nr:hypothetical protein [Hephaestia caeni]RIA37508.1 hypothetical protein DFR49_3393 [Hephaestia caeni]